MSDKFDLTKICKDSFDFQVSQLALLKMKVSDLIFLSVGVGVRGDIVRKLLMAKSLCDASPLNPDQREEIELEILSIEKTLKEHGFDVQDKS